MRTNDKSRSFRRAATGTSALALATALAASPAHAQSATPSFNAPNPTVASGTVTFDRGQTTPGVDIYNVQSPTAVLDFTPSDTSGTGVINFQNAGTTAVYQGGSNFTVLNRIVPTDPSRAIQFNGTVRSLVNSSPGGSVWFYSPGGIMVGSGAVFDVGSLLLSTGDPTGGSGTIGSTTSFSLSSANSNAAVTIQPGAQITATPEGSYVALVAPIVNQNGSVRVNGSAAYVAAEQATLSINQGLFDISVAVGSDGNGTPLVHNGTTTGPASTGAGDAQGIFMVAVPKNTAITMLIAPNGQLGFDVAGAASVENGAIYLQAGGDLSVDRVQSIVNRITDLPQSTLGASIQIDSGDFTSPMAAQASTDLLITAGTSPGIKLAGDSYFYGGNQVHLVANTNGLFTADKRVVLNSFGAVPGTVQIDALAGSTMTFAGLDLRADALSGRFFTSLFDVSKGGNAALRTTGGAITVNGDLNLSAVGSSPDPVSTFGGNADISLSGGSITAASNTFINASANASAASLIATAGQANVFSDAGGSAKFASLLSLNANGTGTNGTSGKGGRALVTTGLNGGSIEAATVNLNADGIGGSAPTGTAGSGTGGDALIQAQDTTATASIKVGSATVSAIGDGGDASSSGTVTGGAGTGGLARVLVGANGSYVATGLTGIRASAEGGDGAGGGAGGDATAGNGQFSVFGGTINAQTVDLSAGTFAGSGGTGPATTTPGGNGGNAVAGAGVSIFATSGGTITATDATLDGSAFGGSGGGGFNGSGLAGAGGSATGSSSGISISGSGQITLGLVNIRADANGGGTGSGLAQSGLAGGTAQGGDTFVAAGGGTIQLASLDLTSDARGGSGFATGSNGGDATAGNASAGAVSAGTLKILTAGSLDISADAFGGSATTGGTGTVVGGKGTGGLATVYSNPGGAVDSMASFVFLDADGDGGSVSGGGNGTGGIGQGGSASMSAGGGTITVASGIDLNATGSGGSISGAGTGGTGIGGVARLSTFSGASTSKVVVNGSVTLDASGSGGFASNGKGGDGLGGVPADQINGPFDKGAYLAATGGSVTVTGDVDMDATGDGGSGSTGGGAGTGGISNLVAFGGVIDLPGTVSIRSTGSGGDGFDGGSAGGNGSGGSTLVSASSGGDSLGGGVVPTGIPSKVTLGTLFQDASGTGGDGGAGATGGNGGAGGNGLAGVANLIGQAGSGTLIVGDVNLSISGFGGQGGDGGAAPASGGNGGNGGRGGDGTGGFTNFGTASGPATTNNDGSATMANVQVTVFGAGGNGGDGISGGNGGAGGTGTGGGAFLLSRGAPVSTQTVSLLGFAVGGNGGAGATLGAGGDAVGGSLGLLTTNRFQRTERGSYNGTSFSTSAFAQGGTGSTTGATTAGQVSAEVTQADVTLDSLSLFAFGTNSPAAGSESQVVVNAGTLDVGTSLSVSAVGDFRFGAVNGGVLKASSLELSTGGSLLPPVSGTPGLIDVANSFSATFGGDFVTTSNFNVTGSFHVDSGGQLQVGDVTSGRDVSLTGDGPVTAGNIVAGDNINLNAQGALTTGDLSAESGYGSVFLQGGDIATGNIRAADGLLAFANGTLTTGDVTAGLDTQSILFGEVSVTATGAITMGNITAPSVDISIDNGDTIDLDMSFTAVAGSPGFYVLNDDFTLPAGATNTTLTISSLNFDDRGAVLLNDAIVDHAGINAPGQGNLMLTSDGPNDPFTYTRGNGARDVTVTSGFVSGQNSFRLVVNDTNNGIFGTVLPSVNISSADIAASVSFNVGSVSGPATIKTGDIKSERITIQGPGDIQTGKLTTGDFYSNFTTEDDYLVGLGAGGNVTTGDIVSLDYVGLESATGSISTGSIDVGKSALLLAKTDVTTGAITGGTGPNNDIFISNVSIVDSNPDFASLSLSDIFVGNFDPSVLSTATPVRLDGKITLNGAVTTGGFAAAATGGFETGSINAVNRLLIDSGAALALGDLTTGDALNLTSDGALTVGNVQANRVDLTSTGSVTTGAIGASGPVHVNAGSFASFTGAVGGSEISVTSADLRLGPSGRLGNAGTTQLRLVAQGSQVTLGGTGASGYTIDAAEAQRLQAQSIDINASAPVTIATLSLNGSGAGSTANLVGDNGQLTVNTSSGIRVAGAFTLANAGTGNRVALRSGDRIAVATDSGGMITLSGSGSGSLGGTLELAGNTIAVATGSLLDQLAANPNFSGRNTAFATPASSSPNAAGVIQANRLELAATNLIAIQNAGSSTQFAGFSAGAGGMQVTSRASSTAPLDLVLFGRVADGSGNFKMNNDTLGQITFTGGEGTSGSFASASAVNGCAVGSGCTVAPPPAPPPPPETPPAPVIAQISTSVADTVQGSLDAAADPETVAALPTVTLITTIDTGQLRTDPLISDPVSGGGNPSLWDTPDEQNDRREDDAKPTPRQGDHK